MKVKCFNTFYFTKQNREPNNFHFIFPVSDVKFSEVAGKCYLAYSDNLDESVEEWTAAGPNRFYFSQAYNASEKTFVDPPNRAMSIGKPGKGKGKSKCKNRNLENNDAKKLIDKAVNYCSVPKKLKTLDVFAGCGG